MLIHKLHFDKRIEKDTVKCLSFNLPLNQLGMRNVCLYIPTCQYSRRLRSPGGNKSFSILSP